MSSTPSNAASSHARPEARLDVRARRPWSIAGLLTQHYAGSTFALLLMAAGVPYWGLARELGGGSPEEISAAETYGGSQIMSAYNQAGDKTVFCRAFLEQVDSGALDIDKALPDALKRAQDIAAQ